MGCGCSGVEPCFEKIVLTSGSKGVRFEKNESPGVRNNYRWCYCFRLQAYIRIARRDIQSSWRLLKPGKPRHCTGRGSFVSDEERPAWPGAFRESADANRRYLKTLPPDRLLHTFRLTAGLPSSAEPLGDWEKPDCELRGHFAGGHYLSACALAFASSNDEQLKSNGDLMVAELAKCQAKHKNGYLSAFPQELFDRLRDGVNVWAPFYTIHKVMAGHLDMYTLTGNEQALDTVEKMAQWVRTWSDPLSEQQMQRVLLVEYGGMGEVLCNLYAVTGKHEYLNLAKRFDKKVVLRSVGCAP